VKGAIVLVPLAVTVYSVYFVVVTVDGLIPFPFPGLGLAITLASITLFGFLASNVVGRKVVDLVERGFTHLPLVRIVYTSIKDLINAFVGDKRSFDRPVVVTLNPEGTVRALGFVTCDRFDDPRLSGFVAVYFPQSYNFAGNLLVVPRDAVHSIDADKAQFMAFIVSGGVAEMHGARTVMDPNFKPLLKR